jgi:hypothetical protein
VCPRACGPRPSPAASAYREHSGRIEATWSGLVAPAVPPLPAAEGAAPRTKILIYPDQQVTPYRYMFEKLADKSAGAHPPTRPCTTSLLLSAGQGVRERLRERVCLCLYLCWCLRRCLRICLCRRLVAGRCWASIRRAYRPPGRRYCGGTQAAAPDAPSTAGP